MQIAFALPDPADTGGGNGLAYATSLGAGLRHLGHDVQVIEGNDPIFPPGTVPVIDGLLLPGLLDRTEPLAAAGAIAVVHHALARAGRAPAERDAVAAALRVMLPRMRRVVATSQPVADRLQQEFGLATVDVVEPGADDLPRSQPAPGPCRILAVGVLTPRKGHDALLHALAPLTDLDWSLTIAGAAGRDPVHAASLAALIPELGLAHRVRLLADPDDAALEPLWREAHLFALATRWEGYAGAVAEALRRGVPVVVTQGGGALVPPDAGAVCAPDDAPTFSKCLRRVIFDHALRGDMADAAWHAGQALPGWAAQAVRFDQVLGS